MINGLAAIDVSGAMMFIDPITGHYTTTPSEEVGMHLGGDVFVGDNPIPLHEHLNKIRELEARIDALGTMIQQLVDN